MTRHTHIHIHMGPRRNEHGEELRGTSRKPNMGLSKKETYVGRGEKLDPEGGRTREEMASNRYRQSWNVKGNSPEITRVRQRAMEKSSKR